MASRTLQERLEKTQNALLRKLFRIMIAKKSNLCVAANFETVEEAVRFVDKVGKHICILKTQTEGFDGNAQDNLKLLYEKKKEHNFLLFEDRKFYDGAGEVKKWYLKKYHPFVDLVTVAAVIGDSMFSAIEDVIIKNSNLLPDDEPRGVLAVCQLSFAGAHPIDSEAALNSAVRHPVVCSGVIAQDLQLPEGSDLIKATPGVHLRRSSDGGTQQWNHPSKLVANGTDIIIVGRGIYLEPEDNWEPMTREYKEAGWRAYEESLMKK